MRLLPTAICLATLAASAAAGAQFNGPAPLAWRFAQPTKFSPTGTPFVDGDTIYVSVGQRVFALDKASGNQKWRFPEGATIAGDFKTMPIAVNGYVIGVSDNGYMYGLNAATGAEIWRHFLPKPAHGAPVVAGKYVGIALNDGSLMALDPATGTEVWSAPIKIEGGIEGTLASYQDSLIVFDTENDMLCYDIPSEKLKWKMPFTTIDAQVTPVIYGDTAYVNSGNYLTAVNVVSGNGKWQRDVGEELEFQPGVCAAGIMTLTRDGRAISFDLDGNRYFRVPVDLGVIPVAAPAGVGKYFIVPSGNGAINLVDPKKGVITWSFVMKPMGHVRQIDQTAPGGGLGAGGGPFGPGGPAGLGGGTGGADSDVETVTETTGDSSDDASASTQSPFGAGGPGGLGVPGGGRAQNSVTYRTTLAKYVNAAGPATISGKTLLVMAQDGSLLAFDNDLGVDLTPPEVKLVFPNPGDQVSGQPPLTLVFSIEDQASGVNEKSVQILLDGNPVEFEKTKEGYYVIRVTLLGKVPPLKDGRHTFRVIASDWMGNVAKDDFVVIVDNSLRPMKEPGSSNSTQGGLGLPPGLPPGMAGGGA